MCGIAGLIDFKELSSNQILLNMSASIQHRGPDSSGQFFQNKENIQLGFTHQRLSIIDLSELGRQPMQFENFTIVLNGEIYNYKEIGIELSKLGHKFIGSSDTEVVLHAFAEWGIDCVDKLVGMFAFAIYNKVQDVLYLVRDRAGVKPMYYYHTNDLFLFASETKAFHQHPVFKPEIDSNALSAYLQFGNLPSSLSIYKNCYKLLPAHYLKYSIAKREICINKYWNVYDYFNQPKLNISFNEALEQTEHIMNSAFQYRMIADVPVGVFLSGGYDSACLAAMLQKNSSTALNTFTISVPDIGLNEAPFAKQIADYLGTNHYEYSCSENEALNLLEHLPYYYDEPFADSSALPTMLVSKMARDQVKVALSADGGDELFAGYNRYDYLMKHGNFLNSIPGGARRLLHGLMNNIPASKIPILKNKYNFHNRYEKLKGLLLDPSSKNMMLSLSRQFSDEQVKKLILSEFKLPDTSYLSDELKDEFFSPLSYMLAIDYQTYLPDDILQKVDRASMAFSLEAREPYLDHRLVEWAARLPDHFKYNKGIKKYILKEITHQYIPKNMMERPKMGFAIPLEKWLETVLKEKVLYYLNSDRIKNQRLLNEKEVSRLVTDFYSGKRELALKVWTLFVFQLWMAKWMN